MIRKILKTLLYWKWRRSLSCADRLRLDYWGATGNASHHPYSWAE